MSEEMVDQVVENCPAVRVECRCCNTRLDVGDLTRLIEEKNALIHRVRALEAKEKPNRSDRNQELTTMED